MILKIAAIVGVLRSQRSQRFYGNQFSAIVMIVNDHMELRVDFILERGPKNSTTFSHSELLFRCKCVPKDNFLGRVSRDGNIS